MDPRLTLLQAITLAMEYILLSTTTKPGDCCSLHSLYNLDCLRQQLQVDLGMATTDLCDPCGLLRHPPPKEV